MDVPSHIPVYISKQDIGIIEEELEILGYNWTFYQIIKPNQVFGLVKEVQFNGRVVEHHVRCYQDGKITTEIELRRIKDLWLHLTSHSISAHEEIIEILEEKGIQYEVDGTLRDQFKQNAPSDFKRDYLELFRWFFYGVCFWVPLGYIWKFYTSLKSKLKR